MKNFYIAVLCHYDDGKNYAFMLRVDCSTNLLCRLNGIQNAIAANLCPTKKAAQDLVTAWNNDFIANGTYLFSVPTF